MTSPLLTPAALAELKEKAKQATQGPWAVYHDGCSICDESGRILSTDIEGRTDDEAKANVVLLAACSPEVVTALVEEIERLRENERLRHGEAADFLDHVANRGPR